MDKKNKLALERYGARKILTDLVNIEPGQPDCKARVNTFLNSYGQLRPEPDADTRVLAKITDDHKLPEPSVDVLSLAAIFRTAWTPTATEIEVLGGFIAGLFAIPAEEGFVRPGLRLDFLKGRWSPTPRTLAESLAIELERSRKMLHRCERADCQSYFVKSFSRDRYCSTVCSEEMRSRSQLQWQRDNREKINARRRKPTRGKSR